MSPNSHARAEWSLTSQALDKLLSCLHPNRDRAAEKYEAIRRKLQFFFEARSCNAPEECTDETMSRVARKVSEGAEIYAGDPASYFYGVARNVLREYRESREHRFSPLDEVNPHRYLSEDPHALQERRAEHLEREREMECLERCIQTLSLSERELILSYYQGETGAKIRSRKQLAEKLKIPINAVRIRAFRVRAKLEACLEECLGEGSDF
jgi:RNA polymerase sigma factor (sigma-70 family)